jgi:hypothetical protein
MADELSFVIGLRGPKWIKPPTIQDDCYSRSMSALQAGNYVAALAGRANLPLEPQNYSSLVAEGFVPPEGS